MRWERCQQNPYSYNIDYTNLKSIKKWLHVALEKFNNDIIYTMAKKDIVESVFHVYPFNKA